MSYPLHPPPQPPSLHPPMHPPLTPHVWSLKAASSPRGPSEPSKPPSLPTPSPTSRQLSSVGSPPFAGRAGDGKVWELIAGVGGSLKLRCRPKLSDLFVVWGIFGWMEGRVYVSSKGGTSRGWKFRSAEHDFHSKSCFEKVMPTTRAAARSSCLSCAVSSLKVVRAGGAGGKNNYSKITLATTHELSSSG